MSLAASVDWFPNSLLINGSRSAEVRKRPIRRTVTVSGSSNNEEHGIAALWQAMMISSRENCRTAPRAGAGPSNTRSAARRKLSVMPGGRNSERSTSSLETVADSSRRKPEAAASTGNGAAAKRKSTHDAIVFASISASSAGQSVDCLEHFIGSANNTRIRFIGTLSNDHLNKFADHIHVGVFQHALLDAAQSFTASRRANNGISGSSRFQEIIVPRAVQPARIGKGGQLNSANLLRLLLIGKSDADRAITAAGDVGGGSRNSDCRLQLIALGIDDDASRIKMEGSGTGVGHFTAGKLNLKKSSSLHGEIQRIASLVVVSLLLNHFRRSGARTQTDLQTGGISGLLRGRCSRSHHILINQILKLQPTAAKSRGAGIGQIVCHVI